MLVLEKNTGRVLRVTDGVVQGPVLDLAVNSFSERGLLGIALHPFFPFNRGVYLTWSCTARLRPIAFVPSQERCDDTPTPGDDSGEVLNVPLLGNRVDRFEWNGSELVFDRNLIMIRSFQNDAAPQPPMQGDENQPARGNHNGGVIRFGAIASSTSSSATSDGAGSFRTSSSARRRRQTTTSSADPSPTTPTSRA